MIAKYFREGNNEISLETIRRYFPADKNNPGTKYAKIPPELKLFQLKPAKKRSWNLHNLILLIPSFGKP